MEIYLICMLISFSITSYKVYKRSIVACDKELNKDGEFILSNMKPDDFCKLISLVSSMQFVVLAVNYYLFFRVVGVIAIALGFLSFVAKLQSTCFSLKVLKKVFEKSKTPFYSYARFMRLNQPLGLNVIYLDTFIILYTLMHI